MIKSVQFRNFKVLRDATLPLGRFTLIVGPNGSGKSTAIRALQVVANPSLDISLHTVVTADRLSDKKTVVQVVLYCDSPYEDTRVSANWSFISSLLRRTSKTDSDTQFVLGYHREDGKPLSDEEARPLKAKLARIRTFSFDARSISLPVQLRPNMELDHYGDSLTGVLDRLRDQEPERFEALNDELGRWFPEFDRILFDTPDVGQRAFLLRTRNGRYAISAADVSHGTLLSLAIMTLSYLPDPPSIVCLEEPDRGIHPRLLREIRDALYRLSYPENSG